MSSDLDAVETFTDPAARIKRISKPVASPAACVICGKDKHPLGFAQTDNFDFEFYGTVYFCADCVGDYARIFGYMSRNEIEDLIKRVGSQEQELQTLRTSVVNLETILDAYSSLRGISPSDVLNHVPDDVPAKATDEGNITGEGTPLNESVVREGVSISGEQPTDERSNEQGRNDVHDVTADDPLAELGLSL